MRRVTLLLLTVSVLLASSACAQSTSMKESKLLQYVDSPLNVTFSDSGEAFVNFEDSYVLSVDGYRKVCLEIEWGSMQVINGTVVSTDGSAYQPQFDVVMGKISGNTLADIVGSGSADGHIHCYDVVGPEMILVLRGVPNTTTQVQLWVYLTP